MLLDNKKHGKVGDQLRRHLHAGSKLAVISKLFSIYAFDALKKELGDIDSLRLLLRQNPNINQAADTDSHRGFQSLAGDPQELRLKNQLNQVQIARDCAQWLTDKARIRATSNPAALSQNLFHITNSDQTAVAIQGGSDFTSTGLGYTESSHFHMNTLVTDSANSDALLEWFETIWNDPKAVQDAKQLLLQQLNVLTRDHAPEFIYFLTLYHVFKDLIEDLDEENIIKTRTGFKQTLIWNKLYKFQRDGVLGAIDKLEKYNGCIIADSVGLGKTFEGLAVIKYYELRNDRVLVLCPKKLRDNWTVYTINDTRNRLAADRFNFDVLNHTDLTRLQGRSGEINLETLNWGNYDLVVIDESHNFRNTPSSSKGITRYTRLMDDIIRSGVRTKVLMLSATPVNNRMNDLKNQVAFITEGQDNAYSDSGITSIEHTLKKAQTHFNHWLKLDEAERSVDTLLGRMNFDYFKLLDILTIARSRKHIEKYYDIAEIGDFPERLKPINIKENIDTENQFPPLKQINRAIRRLKLSAYSPLKYVRADRRQEYNRKYDIQVKGGASVFKQVDREQSLIHLMRVNLLKRMESSINSFSLTLEKLLAAVNGLITRLDSHDSSIIDDWSIEDVDIDDPEFDSYLIGNTIKVLIRDMDQTRWRQDLQDDRAQLTELLSEARQIDAERDAKLQRLKHIIQHKCQHPINPGNQKILLFTAFADTANYLYQHLADWAYQTLGIHSARITGNNTNKTTLASIGSDFDTLLAAFSPISKERPAKQRPELDPQASDQIDLLIATDCISEGQNLQDCDTLINYDIHWNPVRIIQRFGRIDRLGSRNKVIQLLNFWPNMELDEYINLEARVSGRMVLLDISATGEENVIEQDGSGKMNDLEYRRKQLQQLQDSVVDLEDISGGVSITDLTLNDFRMDLTDYLREQRHSLQQAPTGLHAASSMETTLQMDQLPPGVIFCLKNTGKPVQTEPGYPLAPYYLVYVSDQGEITYPYSQSRGILDLLKKQGLGKRHPDRAAVDGLNHHTDYQRDMQHYRGLLQQAIASIIGSAEEHGVDSLFSRGGTHLTADSFAGQDDFEVITYLIVSEPQ